MISIITLDRLKRSTMRTQATQTEVKKNQNQTYPNVASSLEQKHGTSPRVKKKTWMVSESVQTNGSVSPSPHYHSLSRAQSLRAGYQVKVYDLDLPVKNNTNFSQPRTGQTGRDWPSVDQQVNYSSNSVKLDYKAGQGKQQIFR